MKMNSLNFKVATVALLLLPLISAGQKQQKQWVESYETEPEVVIEVNTTYTDIQFETWNKNRVEVVTTVIADNMPDKDFEKYLNNPPLEVLGNRQKVLIKNKNARVNYFHFQPDVNFSSSTKFIYDFVPPLPPIPALPEMPEMNDLHFNFSDSLNFDYDAYQKEGEVYLKAWRENWEKNIAPQMKIRMEEWRKKWEKQREEMQANRDKMKGEREKIQHEKEKMREEQIKLREEMILMRKHRDSLAVLRPSSKTNTFIYQNFNEKPKVKTSVIIRVPKGAKLNLNVRFGEIKLAQNLRNIQAKLSYSSLWAQQVDGQNTFIESAYAPVNVSQWNEGQLRLKYVNNALLENVKTIRLYAESSDLTIQNFEGNGHIESRFGKVLIVNKSTFETLSIRADNSDVTLQMAKLPYNVRIQSKGGVISYPKEWKVKDETTDSLYRNINGYSQQKTANNQLEISNTFGKVIVQ